MLAEEFRQWPTNVGYLTAFTRHSTPYRANAASGLTLDPGFQLPGIDSCKQTTAQVWAFPSPGLVSNERYGDLSPIGISPVRMPPVCVYFRRQVVQMSEETNDRPYFLVGHPTFPCAHPGIANSVLDSPKQLPLGFLWMRQIELWHTRIEPGHAPTTGIACIAVAARAIITVDVEA